MQSGRGTYTKCMVLHVPLTGRRSKTLWGETFSFYGNEFYCFSCLTCSEKPLFYWVKTIVLGSLLAVRCSPLAARCSKPFFLCLLCSLLAARCSQLAARCSLLKTNLKNVYEKQKTGSAVQHEGIGVVNLMCLLKLWSKRHDCSDDQSIFTTAATISAMTTATLIQS